MSWHFSQALVEEFSRASCSNGELFAQWKSTLTVPDDLCSGKMKGTFHRSPFGMMFVPLMDGLGKALLTWFLAASRAQTSAFAIENNWALKASVQDFGLRWRELFVKFDLASSSWKTAQTLFTEDLPLSSVNLPTWGMCLNGAIFQRRKSEPRIIEKGFSWLLTPTANNFKAWSFQNPYALIRKNHADGNLQEQLMRLYLRMITPECAEHLMMWPQRWSDYAPLGTDRFQAWLQEHSGSFQAFN